MTLAFSDTVVTPIDLIKIQSGEPSEFQQLYRKYYATLVAEATQLLNNEDQAIFLVQLSCIQSWIRCEEITSEKYYFGYMRTRVLRYSQAMNDTAYRVEHELGIVTGVVSDQYALSLPDLTILYGNLPLAQKGLARQTVRSLFIPAQGNPLSPETAPAANLQTLLNYAFYSLHYILA